MWVLYVYCHGTSNDDDWCRWLLLIRHRLTSVMINRLNLSLKKTAAKQFSINWSLDIFEQQMNSQATLTASSDILKLQVIGTGRLVFVLPGTTAISDCTHARRTRQYCTAGVTQSSSWYIVTDSTPESAADNCFCYDIIDWQKVPVCFKLSYRDIYVGPKQILLILKGCARTANRGHATRSHWARTNSILLSRLPPPHCWILSRWVQPRSD